MYIRYNKENLSKAINESKSWAEVCRKLNLTTSTGAQSHVKRRANHFEVDYSHFTGQGHNKGKTWVYATAEKYLFNGSIINSHRLKEYLFRENLKCKQCENCGIKEWMNEECVFELDHINNNPLDNRFENLKIVCPNCHAVKTRKARKKVQKK